MGHLTQKPTLHLPTNQMWSTQCLSKLLEFREEWYYTQSMFSREMRFLYSCLTTKQKFFSVRIYQMKRKVNEQVIKTKFSCCFTKPHSKFSSIKPNLMSERLFLWTVSRIPESLCLCQTAVWVRPCVNNWSNWSIKVNFVSFNVCFFTPYVCQ